MNYLTELLKKSIAFESSKSDPANLMTHKRDDLNMMRCLIERALIETEDLIKWRQNQLNESEDLSEQLEINWRQDIVRMKAKLETLLAYRAIFLSCARRVKS